MPVDDERRAQVRTEIDALTRGLIDRGFKIRRWQLPALIRGKPPIHCDDLAYSDDDRADLRNAPRWKSFRQLLLSAREHKCQNCPRRELLEVHHRYYFAGHRVWEYEAEDVLVLCKTCHSLVHGRTAQAESLLLDQPRRRLMREQSEELSEEEVEWLVDRALGYHVDPTATYDEDNAAYWWQDVQEEKQFTAEQALPWFDASGEWVAEDD